MSGRKFTIKKKSLPSRRSKDEPPSIKTFKTQFGAQAILEPEVKGAGWRVEPATGTHWVIGGHPFPLDKIMKDADYLIQLAEGDRKDGLNPVYIWDYVKSGDFYAHVRSIYDENDDPTREQNRLDRLINWAQLIPDEEKDLTIPRINAIDFFLGKDFETYFKDPNYKATVKRKRDELKKWYDTNKPDMEKAEKIYNDNYGIAYYWVNSGIDKSIKEKDKNKYRIDNPSMEKDGWKKDFMDWMQKEVKEKSKPKKEDFVVAPFRPVYVEYWKMARNWLYKNLQYKKP